MKYTTLNEIKNHTPCHDGWKLLLENLGKTKADSEALTFGRILKSNGIDDAIWALRTLPFEIQAPFLIEIVELALPLFEKKYPGDGRPRQAIDVVRAFVQGKATESHLTTACAAACAAARAAYVATRGAAAYFAARAAYFAARSAAADHTAVYICYGSYIAVRAAIVADSDIKSLFIDHFC